MWLCGVKYAILEAPTCFELGVVLCSHTQDAGISEEKTWKILIFMVLWHALWKKQWLIRAEFLLCRVEVFFHSALFNGTAVLILGAIMWFFFTADVIIQIIHSDTRPDQPKCSCSTGNVYFVMCAELKMQNLFFQRDRCQSPGKYQVWGKSGLRWKSWFFSKKPPPNRSRF